MDLRFTQLGIQIQTQVEVVHLPYTIDVVLVLDDETDQQKVQFSVDERLAGLRSEELKFSRAQATSAVIGTVNR